MGEGVAVPPSRSATPAPVRPTAPNFNASGDALAVSLTAAELHADIQQKINLLRSNYTEKTKNAILGEINMFLKDDRNTPPDVLNKFLDQISGIERVKAKDKNPRSRPIQQVLSVHEMNLERTRIAKVRRTARGPRQVGAHEL